MFHILNMVLRSRHLRVVYCCTLPTHLISGVRSWQASTLVDSVRDLAGIWPIFYRTLLASTSY